VIATQGGAKAALVANALQRSRFMTGHNRLALLREWEQELEKDYPLDLELGDLRSSSEFQTSAARLRAEADFALKNPGFVTTVGTDDGTRENELILWNYAVGSAQTRPEHNAALARVAPRWRRDLLLPENSLLRIKIIGSASSASGDSIHNDRVARSRAEWVRSILTRVFGIAAGRIIVETEGDRLPLADEMDPESPINMARDRRVELFLFIPGRLVTQIDRVSVPFSGIETNLDSKPNLGSNPRERENKERNLFTERSKGIWADGRATWSGPPDSSIGFIQLLTHDERRGFYESKSSRRVILDFARCTRPFLPCRDVVDAADPLNLIPPRSPGEIGRGQFTRVRVPFRDFPGNVLPLQIIDPLLGPAKLVGSKWSMDFVLLFGVRRGESFLPLHFITWSIVSARKFPGAIPVAGLLAFRTGGGQGAPTGLQFEQAMAGATCRLRTRSMDYLRTRTRTPDDECPEIPRGRGCPPLVCTAHVTRV
jgi:outer membrane protein OmpA-like peptidoglycan-associated protein